MKYVPQSATKNLRKTLVFMWNNALPEKFNFCFFEDFTSTDKILISKKDWALGKISMKFWAFTDMF